MAMLGVAVGIVMAAGWLCGWRLFRKNTVPVPETGPAQVRGGRRLSVVIPARNEAHNLPHLLESLKVQTLPPDEIIVVDDASEDGTGEVAARFGATVFRNDELPGGWTGKNWALWNGYRRTSGDLILFLDADVRMAPDALASLVAARDRAGGVISVVPFHLARKFHEKLLLVVNLLGMFAFTSPHENDNPGKGLYGSCILTTREDYEKVNGHAAIRSEVTDDLSLGGRYMAAGIPVTNFLGAGLVSFRMYPKGIRSAAEGLAKSAALSMGLLRRETIWLCAFWMIGLVLSEWSLLLLPAPAGLALLAGYVLYTAQIFYLARYCGAFGVIMPVLHPLSVLFFLAVLVYSFWQTTVVGSVSWKGRQIPVKGGREA